jgi:hypothetical protein
MSIFGREVALWIGTIVSLVFAVVGVLTNDGVISDAIGGRITDITTSLAELLTLLAPLIAGVIIRQGVTPISQPKLPVGTPVLVDRPAGQPEDTPPPDAVVALK